MNDIITADGEIIEETVPGVDISTAVSLTRAEIDMQISTARAYPRRPKRVQDAILEMATLDEEAAKESMYALPRGGKPITGPSIRFAEAVKQAFSNCRASSRVTEINRVEKYVEAEGVFLDLETNVATKVTHRRRIVDKRGRLFPDDMILVTGNAACSVAMREAILKGVPKPIWRKGYEAVVSVVTGDVKTLADRRDRAIKAFAAYGVKPEQVYAAIAVEGEADIKLDHLPVLFGMYSAIKNGESTVEEMFAPKTAGITHQVVANPLADDQPAPPIPEIDAAEAAPAEAAGVEGHASSPAVSAEPVDWRERGAQAFRDGMSRRAVPPEARSDKEAIDAWLAGFDEAKGSAQ